MDCRETEIQQGRWKCRIFKGADYPKYTNQAAEIRSCVFTGEQGMRAGHDPDELDAQAVQLLITDSEVVGDKAEVATARILPYVGETGMARIGRIAVVKSYRGQGLGLHLVGLAVKEARRLGYRGALINGQSRSQGFYEKAGFHADGEEFIMENMPHQRMKMLF